jgi:hypothetical protein
MQYTFYKCTRCREERLTYYNTDGGQACPECNAPVTEYAEEIVSGYDVAYNQFEGRPAVEKKKMLKKRSNEHYKKHIKEKKEYLDSNII